MSSTPEIITITEQPIELCKLLKIANLVSGGGEAKIVISEGYVFLNGEVEYRKRKKVIDGDIVEFNGEVIEVHFDPSKAVTKAKIKPEQSRQKSPSKSKNKTSANKSGNHKNQVKIEEPSKPSKRKPISF